VITAQQVTDTLALLIPGFIALKIFYVFGLQTKRSDAEWALWSILVSAPIAGVTTIVAGANNVVVSLVLAVIIGGLLIAAWRLVAQTWPTLKAKEQIRAWDVIFGGDAPWLQVEMSDGRVFVGQPKYVASSVDTDALDLYLVDVRQSDGTNLTPIPGIEGLLIARSDVNLIAVFQ
jgi:hypothetical protein